MRWIFFMFTQIANIIVQTVWDWWYWGIFVMMMIESSCIIPFPSEVAMIPAGYLAFAWTMNIYMVFIAGTTWAMLGSTFNYFLGKKLGWPLTKKIIKKWGKYIFISIKHYEKVEKFFQKHGSITTFNGRLIIGIRQLISLPAWVFRMHFGKFLWYTFLGAGLWNVILITIGYTAGANKELIALYSTQALLGGIAGFVLFSGIYVFWHARKKNISYFFSGKKIAILWFGREGKSTLHFLRKHQIPDKMITILDEKNINREDFWGTIITGEDIWTCLDQFDIILKTPGISSFLPALIPLQEKIFSQTKIFYMLYRRAKIISVTQTKGKSTTASLIFKLLEHAWYRVKLVGNIGNPVFDEIDFSQKYDYIVYELSSYMLHDLWNEHTSYISILGNIYPDHLDWHKNLDNYTDAKKNILKNAKYILIGYQVEPFLWEDFDIENVTIFGGKKSQISHKYGNIFLNSEKIHIQLQPKLLGVHNWDNMCGVFGVSQILKIPYDIYEKTINTFISLAHRLQNIGTFSGIIFIDDSISTTPESTIAALETFGDQIHTIFLGGTDRWYDFTKLCEYIDNSQIENIVLFPESGQRIRSWFTKKYRILETSDMKKAVRFAYTNTKTGKICLLSTASPSYSIWKNFEEKWDVYQKCVRELAK